MRDIAVALVGVTVGVIAESIAYYFRSKAERFIEHCDDLVEALTNLEIAYRTGCESQREIEMLHNQCHRSLVRILRLRSNFIQRGENIRLLDRFSAIGKHHSVKTVPYDFYGDGKQIGFIEDSKATNLERSALLIEFIREIEHINPYY